MQTGTTTDTTTLNSLLRGEMAAIETYRQALEKVGDEPGVDELRTMRRDHRDAADALWHFIGQQGERPAEGSGAWGAFAKAVTASASLFGNAAALKALKEGEEHGLKQYRDALGDPHLPAACRDLFHTYMTKQQGHIAALDRLLARL
jgi:hypothetical protein